MKNSLGPLPGVFIIRKLSDRCAVDKTGFDGIIQRKEPNHLLNDYEDMARVFLSVEPMGRDQIASRSLKVRALLQSTIGGPVAATVVKLAIINFVRNFVQKDM